ncbi:MAG: long-chain-fatty-acid--CoA ligase [Acidobacteria bacterium]|nr:long-chain-fatty-acid--CoA ligase [Acidobacteriota bacterium]
MARRSAACDGDFIGGRTVIIPLNEYDFLKRALVVHADKEAIVSGALRLTYREFGERVYQWANLMRGLGVAKGDRVAILMPNSHRILEAFFGASILGVILMPLNFRLLPGDFDYILNHGGAKVLLIEEELAALIEPIRGNLKTIEQFIAANDDGKTASDGWQDYETLLGEAAKNEPALADIDENEASALLYTSGTTGKPKGVMLTHRNLYMNAMNSIVEFGIREDDVYLHTLAQFHCNGWGLPYAVTGMGATHVIIRKFEPAEFFNLVAGEQVTFACMPPTMINMALNYPLDDEMLAALPKTTRIGTAGSAPPMASIQGAQEKFGWRVIQIYGLTETSPFLTVSKVKPTMKDLSDEEKLRVQTKTGYPMLGVDLRVVDDEGRDVAPDSGAVGEVLARSNVVMKGYWQQPEATDAVIVDGWFHTGDMALLDREGFIEVVDRKKDLIISGGENVSSLEVEGLLYQHPAVLEAAIIAAPDERWGEVPAAIVVLKPGAAVTEAELIEFCREHLAHYKCPKKVDFLEVLPRTATGKIQKNLLRDTFWSGQTKRVG